MIKRKVIPDKMKAKGNIYCKICEKENIRLAIIKASKNKGHRKDVRKEGTMTMKPENSMIVNVRGWGVV